MTEMVERLERENQELRRIVPHKLVYVHSPESKKHQVTKKIISPERQGVLTVSYKTNSVRKTVWEPRFVVLKHNFLYIFLSDTDLDAEAVFWVHPARVETNLDDPTMFTVVCAARAVHFNDRKGTQSALAWKHAIEASETHTITDMSKAQPPTWVPDIDALECFHCKKAFGVMRRQHHCRLCGLVFCREHCDTKQQLPHLDTAVKLCGDTEWGCVSLCSPE